jgi:hypothetical protein
MGTTHILIDMSMIGKYAAMSKIANHGRKVDSYLFLPYNQARETKTGNVLVYGDGQITLLVPLTASGSISAPRLITPQGEVYVNKLCLPQGITTLPVPNNGSATNMCLMLTRDQAILMSQEIANSVFHNLFFMDGKDIDYVKKVFDNGEVKIFEIDTKQIPRETTDELRTWWANNGYEALLALK